jgi:cation:H+ antiporter
MDPLTFIYLAGGLVLLVVGGEGLVRGASALASIAGVSPLVVGLTVVAAGTSAPELAVSVQATFSDTPDVTVGNVIGSNIFNVLAILGVCALVAPLVVHVKLIRVDVPLMIGASLVFVAMVAFDGAIQWWDGAVLLAMLVGYTAWSIIEARREGAPGEFAEEFGRPAESELEPRGRVVVRNLAFLLAGGLGLMAGSKLFVDGAVDLAEALGVSDAVIGLTVVAAGTSLPEVVTSVIATLRGERDIAIGNVVGSNLFNILGIAGVAAVIAPAAGYSSLAVSDNIVRFDLMVMLAATVACLPIMFTGFAIARWEGALFFISYVVYTAFLVLTEVENPARDPFGLGILLALPLVIATLAWTTYQGIRERLRDRHRPGPVSG